jgi:phosphotransferase system  glucose/maltose/N-acetylglucosamine-specific IIC component
MIIQGVIGIIIGMVITAIGLYAASGGFPGTTWEIMSRVIQSNEWGWYLSIIGIIVLLIGAIITYFGFKKK